MHVFLAFVSFVSQATIFHTNSFTKTCKLQTSGVIIGEVNQDAMFTTPIVGSTSVYHHPPVPPTNAYPSLFSFDVGFARGTATGGEPAVISTAPANQEIHIGQCSQFRVPQVPGW